MNKLSQKQLELVDIIKRHKLEKFIEILVDTHKPLNNLSLNLLVFSKPLIQFFDRKDYLQEIINILDNRDTKRDFFNQLI